MLLPGSSLASEFEGSNLAGILFRGGSLRVPLPDKVLLTALSPSRGPHPTCTCVYVDSCVCLYTGMHMEAAFWVLESQEGEDRPGSPLCRVALILYMC